MSAKKTCSGTSVCSVVLIRYLEEFICLSAWLFLPLKKSNIFSIFQRCPGRHPCLRRQLPGILSGIVTCLRGGGALAFALIWFTTIIQCWGSGSACFRPPGSGSISQRYGSGSGSGSVSFSFLINVFSGLK
jgi:hypothetical protein